MNIFNLIDKLAEAEAELQTTQFVAPCVPGGSVRTRLEGLVREFSPSPAVFEGWGIFSPSGQKARLVEEASLATIERYLDLFDALRVLLVRQLEGRTWLAYPANHSDMTQRFGRAEPLVVRLVDGGRAFDTVVASCVGGGWWFQCLDRGADPVIADKLREAMRHCWHPNTLRIRGLTPEMCAAYSITWRRPDPKHFEWSPDRDADVLEDALEMGGGQLCSYSDEGDYWNVEWTAPSGEVRHSAIAKDDLTVISAGICLSGRDRDFDLQSLVGVVDGWDRQGWW